MKNIISALFLFLFTSIVAFGQTVAVSGTVVDQKGNVVPFAFVRDSQHSSATYTDLNGAFSLIVDSASKLIVTSLYHPKVEAKIKNPSDLKIVMTGDQPAGNVSAQSGKNPFSENTPDMSSTSSDRMGGQQENLRGSKFLFDNWVHGFAISPLDSIKQNDAYLFNYDKLNGNLIFTKDKNRVILVAKTEIKGFSLFNAIGKAFVFDYVPAIDSKHYMQVIAGGSKYKIYKDLGTKFVKADFQTNGFTSSGNKYDEYVNDSVYYVTKLPAGQPQKLQLKTKSLKTVFATDTQKINKFLSDNDADIDENYLKKLGDYMNQ